MLWTEHELIHVLKVPHGFMCVSSEIGFEMSLASRSVASLYLHLKGIWSLSLFLHWKRLVASVWSVLIDQAWNRAISMQVLPPYTNQGRKRLRVAAADVTAGSIAHIFLQSNESLLMKADCTFIQTLISTALRLYRHTLKQTVIHAQRLKYTPNCSPLDLFDRYAYTH